jgi:Sulfotransferase domain
MKSKPKKINKIFGIGLNKTATHSLCKGLRILNFKSLHYWSPKHKKLIAKIMLDNKVNGRVPFHGLDEYDAYTDFFIESTTNIYQELDEAYPGSRFILTVRELDSWLSSREKHVLANRNNPDYKGAWLTIDKRGWTEQWRSHNHNVKEYFKNRPGDLLMIDICKGEGWDKLCPFLNVPIPDDPFPHENLRAHTPPS